MKILISQGCGGNHYTKSSLCNALASAGHNVLYWYPENEPAFDIFPSFEPELFISCTYNLTRAIFKNIVTRPNLKVVLLGSDWGDAQKNIDLNEFPILVANQQEIEIVAKLKELHPQLLIFGQYPDKYLNTTHNYWRDKLHIPIFGMPNAYDCIKFRQDNATLEFESQISFVGGSWKYKNISLMKYIYPLLCPIGKYNIKIYGNSKWSAPQYLGHITDEQERQIYASSKITPNIHEGHSREFGNDLNQRGFSAIGQGQSLVISDYVEGYREYLSENELIMCKSPEEFHEKIDYFLDKKNREERQKIQLAGQKAILKKHSFHHRLNAMFTHLTLPYEAVNMTKTYSKILDARNQLHLLE